MIWNYIIYRTKALIRGQKIKRNGLFEYAGSVKTYQDRPVLDADKLSQELYNEIQSGNSFMAARFGSTELLNIRYYDFPVNGKYDGNFHFNHLCEWSGFFPNDSSLLPKFVALMKESASQVDYMAIWFHPFEDYYIKKLMNKNVKCAYLLNFEPWSSKSIHWSAALAGKKVLVIHPFTETIKRQYEKRSEIFPGTNILPEFELRTVKAVQTLAGTKDARFENWFEALDWMYEEAMKKDFDIAIIGCGAYGMPLAAKIKKAGKQAIHLAGATQLLFGIRGKRWDIDPAFEYVRNWYNDAWVYPDENDKIENAGKVENACYW
ncbi:hypothetical protein [Clostridium transplantifaecale]|uniref:hypothetical protein n=1 Tax=Clostridium transplantifaecale TaxID=2479838 RepID=UPI000F643E47|nr:hypothetical protein [Clostridium transplantifaecale]